MVHFLPIPLFLVLLGLDFSSSYPSSGFSWQSTKALLAFGDSYTYVQGSAGRQNYSFIADALSPWYHSQQLLNDTIIQNQTGTSAGGPNWVEYLTKCGLKTERPADCTSTDQKQLWDFAFAGADVSTRYLPLHHGYSIDLDSQISSFAQQAFPYLPVRPNRTLTAVLIGINDVSDSAKNTSISSFGAFYSRIIGTAFQSVSLLYQLGYRHYLFLNLPPLEHTPGNVVAAANNETLSPNPSQVAEWNTQLARASDNFARNHTDATVMVFDTHTFLNHIWNDPESYDIKDTTTYCTHYDAPDIASNYAAYGCLPVQKYFWYNTGHITYRVHGLLAEGVREFLDSQA